MKRFSLLLAALLIAGLSSCATVKNASATAGNSLKNTGSKLRSGWDSLTGPDIKVASVDPKRFKKFETAEEKLAAFQSRRAREISRRRAANLPIDLPELDDPAFYDIDDLEIGAGILPPKPGV